MRERRKEKNNGPLNNIKDNNDNEVLNKQSLYSVQWIHP